MKPSLVAIHGNYPDQIQKSIFFPLKINWLCKSLKVSAYYVYNNAIYYLQLSSYNVERSTFKQNISISNELMITVLLNFENNKTTLLQFYTIYTEKY